MSRVRSAVLECLVLFDQQAKLQSLPSQNINFRGFGILALKLTMATITKIYHKYILYIYLFFLNIII